MNKDSHFKSVAAVAFAGVLISACAPVSKPVATLSTPKEIRQTINAARAPLTLVHVWATWCQPCREEFPELLEASHAYRDKGLVLQLVSADDPGALEAVEAFLREHHSPVGSLVATELNQDFVELFSPKWSGALPASFFFDASGKLVAEWEGKRSGAEYAATIERLLKP